MTEQQEAMANEQEQTPTEEIQNTPVRVNINDLPALSCRNCGQAMWQQAYIIKRIGPTQSPTKREEHITVPVLVCVVCRTPLMTFELQAQQAEMAQMDAEMAAQPQEPVPDISPEPAAPVPPIQEPPAPQLDQPPQAQRPIVPTQNQG